MIAAELSIDDVTVHAEPTIYEPKTSGESSTPTETPAATTYESATDTPTATTSEPATDAPIATTSEPATDVSTATTSEPATDALTATMSEPATDVPTATTTEPTTPGTPSTRITKDVVLSDDGSPMVAKRGVPSYYTGKNISSAFDKHIHWPEPPKKKVPVKRALFIACASTPVWRKYHRENMQKQKPKPKISTGTFYKKTTQNSVSPVNVLTSTAPAVKPKKAKRTNKKQKVQEAASVDPSIISADPSIIPAEPPVIVQASTSAIQIEVSPLSTVPEVFNHKNNKRKCAALDQQTSNNVSAKNRNVRRKLDINESLSQVEVAERKGRKRNKRKSSTSTRRKENVVDEGNEVWVCQQCGIQWGDPNDAKKLDDWMKCLLCSKTFHETCAEQCGVIDDDSTFVCGHCVT
jgi:hypothetical protein